MEAKNVKNVWTAMVYTNGARKKRCRKIERHRVELDGDPIFEPGTPLEEIKALALRAFRAQVAELHAKAEVQLLVCAETREEWTSGDGVVMTSRCFKVGEPPVAKLELTEELRDLVKGA
jgi:hypothetical protein